MAFREEMMLGRARAEASLTIVFPPPGYFQAPSTSGAASDSPFTDTRAGSVASLSDYHRRRRGSSSRRSSSAAGGAPRRTRRRCGRSWPWACFRTCSGT